MESCKPKLILKDEFLGHIIPTEKSRNLSWKRLLIKIKLLVSRKSYVRQIWIFIIDSEEAQINSVGYSLAKKVQLMAQLGAS